MSYLYPNFILSWTVFILTNMHYGILLYHFYLFYFSLQNILKLKKNNSIKNFKCTASSYRLYIDTYCLLMFWYAIKTSVFNYLWCLLTLHRMICPTVTRCLFYIFSTQHLFFGGLIIKVKICVQSFILYYQILFIYCTGIY